MLQVVVEQAANGGHVDVRKAREATGEICRVVICAEKTAELTIEHVLCPRPVTSRPYSYSHVQNIKKKQSTSAVFKKQRLSTSDVSLNNESAL